MDKIAQEAEFILLTELVGEDKEYYNEDMLYDCDYENNICKYKEAVQERYDQLYELLEKLEE